MKTVEDLMNEGDFRAAAERLRAKLAIEPGDEQAKLLLGTCLHLLGDDEAFMRIDDELSQSPTAKSLPAWPMYHALRVAACGGALLLAGALCDLRAGQVLVHDYGGPSYDRSQLVVPTPKASDGKYSGYVRIKWKSVRGAAFYKVRRATSNCYAKSKTIAKVTGTSYKDKHPAARPRKKYWYWIVPYVAPGQGKKNTSRSDSGYAKQINVAPLYGGPQYPPLDKYAGPPYQILMKYGGPPAASLQKVSSGNVEMTVLSPAAAER
ncbi:MAG: hypothetical protein IKE55_10475 [Kiritimatiellae bacterium]|nr:hypothetical protein [Kiritimatiellia bacterium]